MNAGVCSTDSRLKSAPREVVAAEGPAVIDVRSTSRTRGDVKPPTSTPPGAKAILTGGAIVADVAGPPSPDTVPQPLPAIVVIVADAVAPSTRRTRQLVVSAIRYPSPVVARS